MDVLIGFEFLRPFVTFFSYPPILASISRLIIYPKIRERLKFCVAKYLPPINFKIDTIAHHNYSFAQH